jgi:hypothetical protein
MVCRKRESRLPSASGFARAHYPLVDYCDAYSPEAGNINCIFYDAANESH